MIIIVSIYSNDTEKHLGKFFSERWEKEVCFKCTQSSLTFVSTEVDETIHVSKGVRKFCAEHARGRTTRDHARSTQPLQNASEHELELWQEDRARAAV